MAFTVVRQALLGCLLLAVVFSAPSNKVELKLASSLKSKNIVNIFVTFQGGNKAALRQFETKRFDTRAERITDLVAGLKSLAEISQHSALNLLQARSPYSAVSYKQIWASNELYVKGADAQLVNQLAALPEVAEIREELVILVEPLGEIVPQAQWNLEIIEAPQAWQLPGGNNGVGAVVANIDTGVRGTHEALRNNYRQSYGWFDPYYGDESPSDNNGHGTHTMGTIVGAEVGVAPGAQWVACRGCGSISCTESALKECGQWTLCPTLANGASPDCSKAPSVVSNSWGGGSGDTFFNDIIEAWKAVNIVPVFAIGNSGPTCGSANSPGDQDVIAVGSTTSDNLISGSSSAGPTAAGVIKPDIVAPGNQVRSAWSTSDTSYQTISGTSMATPHVSGAAALLIAQNPNLTYAQVKKLLLDNVDTDLAETGRTCGGIPSTQFPNNQYGHGRVNCRKALAAAISGN